MKISKNETSFLKQGQVNPQYISKSILTTFIVITVPLLIFFFSFGVMSARDRVFMVDPVIDMGSIRRGTPIHTNIVLINLSGKHLSGFPYASCACTTVSSKPIRLNPIDSVHIPVLIDTSEQYSGVHTKDVIFYINGLGATWGQRSTIKFNIK
ncbi:MAG: hypothetical protein ABIY70_25395 [Capsulimonas sp.]|uniref:hypothetical protein n=1 Tax=Capsulimonas sp. TaxID=2494211 RepID=UPI003266C4D0